MQKILSHMRGLFGVAAFLVIAVIFLLLVGQVLQLIMKQGHPAPEISKKEIALFTGFSGDLGSLLLVEIDKNGGGDVIDTAQLSDKVKADSMIVAILSDWNEVSRIPVLPNRSEIQTQIENLARDKEVVELMLNSDRSVKLPAVFYNLRQDDISAGMLTCIAKDLVERARGLGSSPSRLNFTTCSPD
jgi:hypothetical protein